MYIYFPKNYIKSYFLLSYLFKKKKIKLKKLVKDQTYICTFLLLFPIKFCNKSVKTTIRYEDGLFIK